MSSQSLLVLGFLAIQDKISILMVLSKLTLFFGMIFHLSGALQYFPIFPPSFAASSSRTWSSGSQMWSMSCGASSTSQVKHHSAYTYPFFHRIIEYIELEGIKGQGSFFPWASSPLSVHESQVKRGRSVGMPMQSAVSRGSVPSQCMSQPCAGACSFCPHGMPHAGLCPHSTTSPAGLATWQG